MNDDRKVIVIDERLSTSTPIVLDLAFTDGRHALRVLLREAARVVVVDFETTARTARTARKALEIETVMILMKTSSKKPERHEKTRGRNPWCNTKSPKKKSWER